MKNKFIQISINGYNLKRIIKILSKDQIFTDSNFLYFKWSDTKWEKYTSFNKHYISNSEYKIIKEYNTIEEVLIDIPELMLL